MRCHYEVLEVPKDADDSQIKTAYRKLALKWHPDKNLDNPENAKEEFQLVQQAYEVLSDRQERAWYDNHREQILRGSNSEFEDKSLDVFQYFTATCFKGYNDEENGFYTVYRKVFEEIAHEDIEYMDDKEEFCEIPPFGSSTSDYDAVVGPFYSYWTSYSTKKSYVWLDPYNIKETRDRRVFKLMEKENKKIRQKARKERNEEIRALVAFVRKRDKRVQENSKKLEAKIIENRKKQEDLSRQKRLERKKQLNESKSEAEWTKFDNVKTELEQIERSLAQEFGEELSQSEDENSNPEEDETDNLYCVACNKVFKTPKAFQNHELSKKHKENVEKMKEFMLDDDDFEDLSEDACSSTHEVQVDDSLDHKNGDVELLSADSDCEETRQKQKKKKRKSRNVIRMKLSESEGVPVSNKESDNDINAPDLGDEFDRSTTSKKQKRKNKKGSSKVDKTLDNNLNNTDNSSEILQNPENSDTEESKVNTEKIKKTKKSKEKKDKKEMEASKTDIDINHYCVTCKADFPSKNKLFDHLKNTGHSVFLPQNVKVVKNRKKLVRDK